MLHATVSGHVGKDAELRQAGSTQVLAFSVASTEKKAGDKVTTWTNCSMFGARAVALQPYITKGSRVVAVGTLSTRTYTNNAGKDITSLELNVTNVDLVGGGENHGGQLAGGNQQGNGGGGGGNSGYGSRGQDNGGGQQNTQRRQQAQQPRQQAPQGQQEDPSYDDSGDGGSGGGGGYDDDLIPFASCSQRSDIDGMSIGHRSTVKPFNGVSV